MKKELLLLGCLGLGLTARARAEAAGSEPVGHAPAPSVDKTTKPTKEGEMDVTIKGQSREKMTVGKFDPPAAFNLEDIQNFPEERLMPVLNNPISFEEGRDFSALMDFRDDQPVHPWLASMPRPPFLHMKTPTLDKVKDWTFTIIDQSGGNVSKQEGKGSPPATLTWNGEDQQRDHLAVDTVYIPQLSTTDKDGYHHTYMGQPVQLSAFIYKDQGKTLIELSSKKLFHENKAEFTKEAPFLLDKVCDIVREEGHLPFSIQPYDADGSLARSRQQALAKYFVERLVIPENQIVLPEPLGADKRGAAIAIISNAVPGGSGT